MPLTGKTLQSIKVGKEPEGVKVSADGKTLYVTSEVASLVHVIDVASGKIVKNVKVGKRPRRMAITPDGKELWVTNELDASVSIVNTADHTRGRDAEVPGQGRARRRHHAGGHRR